MGTDQTVNKLVYTRTSNDEDGMKAQTFTQLELYKLIHTIPNYTNDQVQLKNR